MQKAIAYLVLLGLSQVWVAVHAPHAAPEPDQRVVEVPRVSARGPVGGPPVRIAYRDTGSGPPVIYLHGSPGSGADALELARWLDSRFRVIAPDLPGFGASSPWIPDYGIRAHARYVLELMQALSIERAHFVAHSMGSGVAYCLAELAPERVASITSYGGIGIQEGEGSGDYAFEHLKYALGYALLVVGPELVPHFGWLGPRAGRHAFIRNFWDTDQRPLRGVLERLEVPLLILHGRNDPLVSVRTAVEHHHIVRHSELVLLDASHFLVFSPDGARRLADEILPFLKGSGVEVRDLTSPPPHPPPAPVRLALVFAAGLVSQHAGPVVGGRLATGRRLNAFGVLGMSFLGIWAGDLCLWWIGRSLGPARLPAWTVRVLGPRIERSPGLALMISRAVPGARILLVPVAGALSVRRSFFLAGSCATAAILATLLVVLGTSLPAP